MLLSIVIRTLNEERYLDDLLSSIKKQEIGKFTYEVIIVDSGSNDQTINIGKSHSCKIVHISREEFSFGRALNMGCQVAKGQILVIISGHCVPIYKDWVSNLCKPLLKGTSEYSYGRQIGGKNSHFSECRIFSKYFPTHNIPTQPPFFCNNANSAILKSTWEKYYFDEELTGLEDMALAKLLVNDGGRVTYVPEAGVYHYHHETWKQIKRRFERESIALRQIMPHIHIQKLDLIRYTFSGIWLDWRSAFKKKVFTKKFFDIVAYRFFQYWGSYSGNRAHRKLSRSEKEQYFYPLAE